MPRLFYTLLAVIVIIAPSGCVGPALRFGDETSRSQNQKDSAEARAADDDESDAEPAAEPPTPTRVAAAEPTKAAKGSPSKRAHPAKLTPQQSRAAVTATEGITAPAKLADDQQATDGMADSKSSIETADVDPTITAEVRAMGFDDPTEEAAALAAIQAAPAIHRAFLLRTMQASLSARQHAEKPGTAEPRRLTPPPLSTPQKVASIKETDRTPADKPAPERRLDRSMGRDAIVALELEQIDDSEVDEPVKREIPSVEGTRGRERKEIPATATRQASEVVAADSSNDQNWQAYVDEAVVALEEHVRRDTDKPNPVDQARLRLLYLVTGRRDEALAAIEGVSAAEKEFWSKELYALGTLFDETHADQTRRAALASEHLKAAADQLGEMGGLVLKNLHFCTEVKGYGAFSPFTKDEFRLGQEVLLYCEVENFQSKHTERGHHTALKGRYQIFDPGGAVIAEKDLSLKEEHCQNKRRDFFIPYFIWMPKQAAPGSYELKLTIEDVHAQQMAEATIAFAIKEK